MGMRKAGKTAKFLSFGVRKKRFWEKEGPGSLVFSLYAAVVSGLFRELFVLLQPVSEMSMAES